MNRFLGMTFVVAAVALFVVGGSFYTVSETTQVVVTQFGKPVGEPIREPGLHFKLPFVQDVSYFEKRWLEWEGRANQIPTRDKKYIWVSTYARWRIVDPLRFLQRLTDERSAQSRLDDIIDGDTRNVVANHNLLEVVRSSNRKLEQGDEAEEVFAEEASSEVQLGRPQITTLILDKAKLVIQEYGIELVDVQIKRVNYIESVQSKVYERMVSERRRIAERHRSEGQGKNAEIRGKKERELKTIESEAYRKTEEIKGKADAEAASIYAVAYSKDANFYRLVKTLDTYKSTIDQNSWLILSSDSEFYRYLGDSQR